MSDQTIVSALFVATALVYATAGAFYLAFLIANRGASRIHKLGPLLVAIGASLHATHIVVASLVWHVCPVEGVHFPVSVASMLMCVAYLVMRNRYHIDAVGAFVVPLALTSFLASHFVGAGEAGATMIDPSPRIKGAILPLHVAMNISGIALFSLAFAAAALYLVQERLLKRKRVEGLFQRLPPLDALDKAEHRFLLAGFPLLTLGIVTGTLWAQKLALGGTADVLRAVFAYTTWILFAGVLLLRSAAGWRGRRAAYGTIAGFWFAVLVLLVYLFRGGAAA